MSRRWALLALVAGLGLGSSARAGVIDALKWDKDCVGGVVSQERLVQRLLTSHDVPWEPQIVAAAHDRKLGDIAFGSGVPELAKTATDAMNFVTGREDTGNGYTVTIAPMGPGETPGLRVVQLLNADAPWLTIACKAAAPEVALPKILGSRLTIAASAEDAEKDIKSRKAASYSYKRDERADKDVTSIALYAGWKLQPHGQNVRPYLAYQKDSGETRLNDLTAGAQLWWFVGDNKLALTPSYETDDFLRSKVYRVEAGWTPPWFQFCRDLYLNPGKHGLLCDFRLVADYADIANPGKKKKLQEMSSYGRWGAGLDLAYYHQVGDAVVTLTGGYGFRDDLDSDKGDAERWTAGLDLSPTRLPNLSLGLEWSKGDDFTSLTPEHKLALKLGYKQ